MKPENVATTMTFGQLGLQPWVVKQCAALALDKPTEVQRLCIPAVLAGKHVVGGAVTGSGKTAAFALPMLQILSEEMYGVFALVMTPSRELAYQIVDRCVGVCLVLEHTRSRTSGAKSLLRINQCRADSPCSTTLCSRPPTMT